MAADILHTPKQLRCPYARWAHSEKLSSTSTRLLWLCLPMLSLHNAAIKSNIITSSSMRLCYLMEPKLKRHYCCLPSLNPFSTKHSGTTNKSIFKKVAYVVRFCGSETKRPWQKTFYVLLNLQLWRAKRAEMKGGLFSRMTVIPVISWVATDGKLVQDVS